MSLLLTYQLLQYIFSVSSQLLFIAALAVTWPKYLFNSQRLFLLACVGMCCSQDSAYTNQFDTWI